MSGPPFSFNAEDAEDAEERRELRAEKGRNTFGRSFLHPERDHQIFVTLGETPAEVAEGNRGGRWTGEPYPGAPRLHPSAGNAWERGRLAGVFQPLQASSSTPMTNSPMPGSLDALGPATLSALIPCSATKRRSTLPGPVISE